MRRGRGDVSPRPGRLTESSGQDACYLPPDGSRELVADGALDMDLLLDKSKYRPTSTADAASDNGAHE
ncbi:hypothetical protein [Streptomyces sp. RTd22]|uniref:hypothetical protein n=1 Tax=Streptomyces sp. RTd22 TaxID=1841249 RepID=UPI000AE2CB3A|nr:hypothetical protein [Streptomyces sp. RTd22]